MPGNFQIPRYPIWLQYTCISPKAFPLDTVFDHFGTHFVWFFGACGRLRAPSDTVLEALVPVGTAWGPFKTVRGLGGRVSMKRIRFCSGNGPYKGRSTDPMPPWMSLKHSAQWCFRQIQEITRGGLSNARWACELTLGTPPPPLSWRRGDLETAVESTEPL